MTFPTDRIYKFTSFSTNSVSALAEKSVWFSKTKNLNDPFENFTFFSEPKTEDEKITLYIKFAAECLKNNLDPEQALDFATKQYLTEKELFLERVEHSINELKEQRSSFLDSLCVFSTSVDIPQCPSPNYANMLMWSHYGQGFSGFCLRFSARKFYDSLQAISPQIGWSLVDYVSSPQSLDAIDYLSQEKFDYYQPVLTKHEQWNYEFELRFLSTNEGLHRYSPEALEVIYIGEKMPLGQQKVLLAIANGYFPHVKVLKVCVDSSGYNVVTAEL